MDSTKPKVGRPPKATPLAKHGKAVKLLPEAHQLLGKTAKRFKMDGSDFASAAITYFAETGLDPRKVGKHSLAKVESRVGEEATKIRDQNADIGNRIVAILRTSERNSGVFLQALQGDILTYLERIERNILSYLVGVEEKALNTILQQVITGGVETRITRTLVEVLLLKANTDYSEASLRDSISRYDAQRDRQVVSVGEKVIAASRMARPTLSLRPAVPEPPRPVPTKTTPAVGASPVGPAASSMGK